MEPNVTGLELLGLLVGALVVGGVIGAIARLLVPGTKRFGVLPTILVGAGGAFFGTLFSRAMGWPLLAQLATEVAVAVAGVLLFRKKPS